LVSIERHGSSLGATASSRQGIRRFQDDGRSGGEIDGPASLWLISKP
jgi:hypothetical protein